MNNHRTFCLLNVSGWGAVFLTNVIVRAIAIADFIWLQEIVDTGLLAGLGLLMTSVLRFVLKRLNFLEYKALTILGLALFSALLSSFVHTLLMVSLVFFLHTHIFKLPVGPFFPTLVGNFVVIFFIHSVWIAAYIGIKYFFRVQQLKVEQLRLEKALNEAELNSLVGQLNPHYMFNALNNIRALMLEDVDKARAMLTSLSASLRYSLNSHKQKKVSLQEELEVVGHFIELARIQLEERLNYQQEVEKGLDHVLLPPMLIQLLVENAIKHGISRLPEGGLLLVKVYREENNLCVVVANDYNPTYKTLNNSTRLGLKNIRERLELIYGGTASFRFEEQEKQVLVQVILPLEDH